MALYIDDNLMIGHPVAIGETMKLLWKKGLVLKVLDGLQDYQSCEIRFS